MEIVPASLTDMQIILYYKTNEQKQQTFKLQTDVERLNNIVCPISAVLIPATVYLTISADLTLISLDGSKLTDPDIGIHPF